MHGPGLPPGRNEPGGVERSRLFQIVTELLRPGGVPELREGLRLDLPDPLSSEVELAADLLQRPGVAVQQPEPELDDLLLSLRKRVKDRLELLLEEGGRRGVDRGTTASESSMKSPRWASSQSPTGASKETGFVDILRISRTLSVGIPSCWPISSGRGSRPRLWVRSVGPGEAC